MLVGSKSWPTVLWRVAAIVRMCIPWKLCSYGQTSGSVHIGEEYVWQALCPRSSEGGGAKSGEVWRCVGAASTPMDSLPAWSRNFGKHIYLVQKFWLGSSLEEPATFSTNEEMPWIAEVLGFSLPFTASVTTGTTWWWSTFLGAWLYRGSFYEMPADKENCAAPAPKHLTASRIEAETLCSQQVSSHTSGPSKSTTFLSRRN